MTPRAEDDERTRFVPPDGDLQWADGAARLMPAEQPAGRPFVAVLVFGRVLHRTSWEHSSVEVSEADAHRFGAPPAPSTLAPAVHRVFDTTSARLQRCSFCVVSPGTQPCGACAGEAGHEACESCQGAGTLTCSTCNGTSRTLATKLRVVSDDLHAIFRLFTPPVPLPDSLTVALHGSLAGVEPPSCLRVSAGRTASAYRGGTGAAPLFLGEPLGDEWARARAHLETIGTAPGVMLSELALFAWPMRLYDVGRRMVTWIAPDGSLGCAA